ncbi:MFS transporter [Prauserella muralis]|uniref:MFS transporter n=1 Tax=Prauserella muralis TaxID=588067 RepID=A0A2V4B0C4_9PSEU|nr:MFS transporter [Prauserella muralis]PXY27453.1 MFS transporter [Prauserella muralis]TWE22846.1 fucose permease [Prauserella muralis]
MKQRLSVIMIFALNGATLGSWAPRTPALSDQVGIGPGPFGLALLGASVGMLAAAVVSGRVVERFGARAVVGGSALAVCAILPLIGAAQSLSWLAAALFALGVSAGVLDVAMNIAGVAVERSERKPIMPLFHAGFSFGALAGSGAAALAAAHEWSPAQHLGVAALAGVVTLVAVVRSLPGVAPATGHAAGNTDGRVGALLRRPALWLLAAIALCSAIAEGASSDWSALLLATEQGASEGAAALAYAGFSLAMALARLAGSWTQARFGHTAVLVTGAGCAGAGLVTSAIAGVPAVSYAGFVLAGAGLATCFPVALGLAGEAGKRPDDSGGEREVAFVTAIAYTGFLAGPPMIGGIAHLTSLSASFVVVGFIAAAIAPAAIAAGRAVARERASRTAGRAVR